MKRMIFMAALVFAAISCTKTEFSQPAPGRQVAFHLRIHTNHALSERSNMQKLPFNAFIFIKLSYFGYDVNKEFCYVLQNLDGNRHLKYNNYKHWKCR